MRELSCLIGLLPGPAWSGSLGLASHPPSAGLSSQRLRQIFAQEPLDLKGIRTSKGRGMQPPPWQCQPLKQGRTRGGGPDEGWVLGRPTGVGCSQKHQELAGALDRRGWEGQKDGISRLGGLLPSHLCSSSGLPPSPQPHSQQKQAGRKKQAEEQVTGEGASEGWGGGGWVKDPSHLRPQEEVHGGRGEPGKEGEDTCLRPFSVTCPAGPK